MERWAVGHESPTSHPTTGHSYCHCNNTDQEGALDTLRWTETSSGQFTTKSAWNTIRETRPTQPIYRFIWSKYIIPTMSSFIWRLVHNWIPVDEICQKKGISLASKCLCCSQVETLTHVFLFDQVAWEAWAFYARPFRNGLPTDGAIHEWILAWNASSPFTSSPHIRNILPLIILWALWGARNEAKFDNAKLTTKNVLSRVKAYLRRLIDTGLMTKKL